MHCIILTFVMLRCTNIVKDSLQEARKIEKKSVDISSGADTDTMLSIFDEPFKRPKKTRKIFSDDDSQSDDSDDSSCK